MLFVPKQVYTLTVVLRKSFTTFTLKKSTKNKEFTFYKFQFIVMITKDVHEKLKSGYENGLKYINVNYTV